MAIPIVIDNFRSMATRWEPEKVPSKLAVRARNCVYVGDTVQPRAGLSQAFVGPNSTVSITGLGEFQLATGERRTMVFDGGGNLFMESPNSGVNPVDFGLGVNQFMDQAAAYHRSYMAFSDLKIGSSNPLVFYFDVGTAAFRLERIGLDPNVTNPDSGGPSAVVGDVDQGIRYAIVLFKKPTGYISGWDPDIAFLPINQNIADRSVQIVNPPQGPSGVTERVIAFTQAGASSAGPYFAILEGAVIDGLNGPITSTVIDNNAVGTYTFNFTDDFLVASTNVTAFSDKIALTPQKSVCYSKTLQRLIWAGEAPDIFWVSEADDPETYMASTGFVQPGFGDEGVAMRAVEFKTETFLIKDNGGFSISDSTLTPSEWSTPRRWSKSGPMGPWAIDVSDQFMAWAHKSGPYVYDGTAPVWIGYEISGNAHNYPNWDRINWKFGHLIYVTIDTETKTIRFGVPMDQSTQNNIEFVCDYSQGLANRRWSYSEIAATRAMRINRVMLDSPNPGSPLDNRVSTTQLLYAMNTLAGVVAYEDPSSTLDLAAPFVQEFQIGYSPLQKVPGIYLLLAVDFTVAGEGAIDVTVYPYKTNPIRLVDVPIEQKLTDHHRGFNDQNERWSVAVTNKGESGNYFILHRIVLWVNKLWETRVV